MVPEMEVDKKLDGRIDGVVDEERSGEVDDELDADTLFMELLDEVEDEVDTGTLLTGLLVMSVVLETAGVEEVDEIADDEIGVMPVVALEVDAAGMVAAKVEAAIASPQARVAMELLRCECMVKHD